jgi:hypothetical protein
MTSPKLQGCKNPVELFSPVDVKNHLNIEHMPYTADVFVGRENELKQVSDKLDRLLSPSCDGGVLLVSGDAGIGKSHLCLKIKQLCKKADVLLLCGTAVDMEQQRAYFPFRSILVTLFNLNTICRFTGSADDIEQIQNYLPPNLRAHATLLRLVFPDIFMNFDTEEDRQVPYQGQANLILQQIVAEAIKHVAEELRAFSINITSEVTDETKEDNYGISSVPNQMDAVDHGSLELFIDTSESAKTTNPGLMKRLSSTPIQIGFLSPTKYFKSKKVTKLKVARLIHSSETSLGSTTLSTPSKHRGSCSDGNILESGISISASKFKR